MKTTFFSFGVNSIFPIDIAYRQFKKYVKDDFEYILFNDAYKEEEERNINLVASSNGIPCVRVPQSIHLDSRNPSMALAETLNWAVQDYAVANNCEVIVLMHADIFPLYNVSILNILGDYSIASTIECRVTNEESVNYIYPTFTIINTKLINIKELDFGLEPGFDVGGKTKDFVKNYPQLIKFLPNHQTVYFFNILKEDDPLAKYFRTDLDICRSHGLSAGWVAEGFYHYMAGSGWNIKDNSLFAVGHDKRMKLFLQYFY